VGAWLEAAAKLEEPAGGQLMFEAVVALLGHEPPPWGGPSLTSSGGRPPCSCSER
jgi:hypothetical protein